jgi:hypothetical protein
MIKFKPVVEFYITNECNLACTNCNRFNDHNFRGHYYWKDCAEEIEKWSHRIDAEVFTIIGGEPSLHPELEIWVANLRRLWPNTMIQIQTNGVNDYHRRMYDLQDQYRVSWCVSVHSKKMDAKLRSQWDPDEKLRNNLDPTKFSPWRVSAVVIDNTKFTTSTVIPQGDRFGVHNSEPAVAFDNCTMRYSHTMFQGKLYKCPVTAVLPAFKQQHTVEMSTAQQALLDRYQPLNADCTDAELEAFALQRDHAIEQCALCPGAVNFQPIVFHKRT